MTTIDKSLYSRQLYTIGKEAMELLKKAKIFISGMTGLGVEVAKNIILYGVKSVTIHDIKKVSKKDLQSNFYASEKDIGNMRVEVAKNKLSALNPYVELKTSCDMLYESYIEENDVIILCDKFVDYRSIYTNILCRKKNKKFILANNTGLSGSVFCDFIEFTSLDTDGELPVKGTLVEQNEEGLRTSEPHGLYVDDEIMITNGTEHNKFTVIKNVNSFTFLTTDMKKLDKPVQFVNTSYEQIKKPHTMYFDSLDKSMFIPSFSSIITDDFERQQLLHCFNIALCKFSKEHGWYEKTDNFEIFYKYVVDEMKTIFKCDINKSHNEVLKKLYLGCGEKLCPVDSIIGSIVAQEAVKAVSNKYMPINQWLYLDFTDIVEKKNIFSPFFNKELQKSHVFIVGAGAIGCELLKNLAMLGVGKITITDMDRIEKSNLNRQFLFRNSDIGKYKSECAKNATMKMNDKIIIDAHINKVCPDTLHIYDREFFSTVTCVMNALDNVEARLFVDNLCVNYRVPLIDSGTLGTKGNVQVVIPNVTVNYGASSDPVEKTIPLCTLKDFPYMIEHCIQWARELFEGMFVSSPKKYNNFVKNPDKIKEMTPSDVTELYDDIMFLNKNKIFHKNESVQFALNVWHNYFRNNITYLVEKHPKDSISTEGILFWSGTKKFPNVLEFDEKDETNVDFIESCANLWCDVNKLPHLSRNNVVSLIKKIKIHEIPKKIDMVENNDDNSIKINNLMELSTDYNVKDLEFEKDDDTNFHIDFITASSNLRAKIYGIETVDKFKTKGIAGKIIPAIVTTTSAVSGIACVELLKIIAGSTKNTNSFINLAIPFFTFSEPINVKKYKVGKYEFSLWDKLSFPNLKLMDFMSEICKLIDDTDLEVESVSYDKYTFFNSTCPTHQTRCEMKISELFETITKKKITSMSKEINLLIFLCRDEDDDKDDEEIEPIKCTIIF